MISLYFHWLRSQEDAILSPTVFIDLAGNVIAGKNVRYKPLQAGTTPAMGTNNVPTVCQVEGGGGGRERWGEGRGEGFEEKNNIRTKKQSQTDGRIEAREDGRTQRHGGG